MSISDTNQIQKEIDHAREQLAHSIDLIADRLNPQQLSDKIRSQVTQFCRKPEVIAVAGGVVCVAVGVITYRIRRRRTIMKILKNSL